MTAAELIALCRAHPKTCGMMGICQSERGDGWIYNHDGLELCPVADVSSAMYCSWSRWLTGALVEKCDELHLEVFHDGDGSFKWKFSLCWTPIGPDPEMKQGTLDRSAYPSRLHALFAALEQHAKETTQ